MGMHNHVGVAYELPWPSDQFGQAHKHSGTTWAGNHAWDHVGPATSLAISLSVSNSLQWACRTILELHMICLDHLTNLAKHTSILAALGLVIMHGTTWGLQHPLQLA